MALTITGKLIRGGQTAHTAAQGDAGWSVTWLPGRVLSQSQAVTAMMIAQAAGGGLEPGDRRWPHIDAWAAELGLAGPDAVVRAAIQRPEAEAQREAGQ